LLAWALARVCRIIAPDRWRLWFGLSTLLAIPAAGLSSQNGNTNIIMLALMAMACVEVSVNRWWRAALLLVLAIALKPQAIILTMLLAALYPRQLIGRLAVGALAMAVLPWLRPNWEYVWGQHLSCVNRLTVAYAPPPGANQDLAGLLVSMHITLSDPVWFLLRAFAAAATLGLSWLATRRFERGVAVVYVLALSVLYNLIFNPRSEGATHALIAITIGIFAAREIIAKPGLLAWSMVAIAVMVGVSHYVMGPLNPWVRPLLAVVVMVYVIVRLARNRPGLPCPVPRE
jgi:hypothetical protein